MSTYATEHETLCTMKTTKVSSVAALLPVVEYLVGCMVGAKVGGSDAEGVIGQRDSLSGRKAEAQQSKEAVNPRLRSTWEKYNGESKEG